MAQRLTAGSPRASGDAPPGSAPLVEARGLVKRFGSLTAVDGIDLRIERGESFGFLGPNGAGKTSTMRMIACMSPLSEGSLRILGLDPVTDGPRIRARIGLVPQEDTLDLELTVLDNLMIYGRCFDLPRKVIRERAQRLLEFAQLADRAKERVEPLSGGMKRRLTIARALVSEPELLILDEPTTGLDPQARHLLWDRLYRLKQEGVTLIITTHYMDEAEQLCDRLVVMDRGKIAAQGTPRELIERYSTREVLELRFRHGAETSPAPDPALFESLGERVEVLPDRVLVYADDGDAALGEAHRLGLRPESALVRRSSLEDVFLHLTGRTLVD
jgi:lipooligosaccharide transport system ATP-binding protein